MKSKIALLSLFTALITTYTAPGFAAPSSKYINLSLDAASIDETTGVLKTFETQIVSDFETIENLMASGQFAKAYLKAKENLDDVRKQLGVDPQAKLTEDFYINIAFPEKASELSDLNEEQQRTVIRSIRDFRGGKFLDILNLSKRTSLIYLKALAAELKSKGTDLTDVRDKMLKDLALSILLPLPVVDKLGTKIIVLFDEISNEDLGYIFNAEMFRYLEQNKDLNISKQGFNDYLAKIKTSLGHGRQQRLVLENFERATICVGDKIPTQFGRFRWTNEVKGCIQTYKKFLNYELCKKIANHVETKSTGGYLADLLADCSANFPVK